MLADDESPPRSATADHRKTPFIGVVPDTISSISLELRDYYFRLSLDSRFHFKRPIRIPDAVGLEQRP